MWGKVVEFERSGLLSLAKGGALEIGGGGMVGGGLGGALVNLKVEGERRFVIVIERKRRLFTEMETFLTEFKYFLIQVSDRTNLPSSPPFETLFHRVKEAKSTFELKIKNRKFLSKPDFDNLVELISSFLDCSASMDWTTIVPESLLFEYCQKRSQRLTKYGRLMVIAWRTEISQAPNRKENQLEADTLSPLVEPVETCLVEGEESPLKKVKGEGVVKMQVKVQRMYKGLLGYQGKLVEFWEEEDKTKFFGVERSLDEIFGQQMFGYSFLLSKSKEGVIELDEDDIMIIDLYKLVNF